MSDPAAIAALRELIDRGGLASLLADVLIACALTRSDNPTPHQVAREAAAMFGWSEETWRDTVEPHLRAELAVLPGVPADEQENP